MEEEGKEERDKGHCLLLSFCVSFLLFGMERGEDEWHKERVWPIIRRTRPLLCHLTCFFDPLWESMPEQEQDHK